MKIKLAILEQDRSYLNRIVTVFGTKYADKLEIYSFTDPEVAFASLNNAKIDVLLASDAFSVDFHRLPNRCAFAYLVDSMGIETLNEQRVICKFQKADLIYKQILSVYSEKATSIMGFMPGEDKGSVVVFASPAGGVGTSTAAAACALHYAQADKKVMYLNLETFGSADLFFEGDGIFDMSDLIYALKSKKANLHLKLESCVKRDNRGVYFYSQPKIVLDRLELKEDEILRLLQELKLAGEYDYIIVDMDFSLQRATLDIFRKAQTVVMVSDGSPAANLKVRRAYEALATMESNADAPLTARMGVVYNRFSSKRGEMAEIENLRLIGGAPVYAGGTTQQVLTQLAATDMFDKLI